MLKNRVLLLLVAVGLAAAAGLAFVTHAPNRLLSGQAVSWAIVLGAGRWMALLPALPLVVGPFLPQSRAVHLVLAVSAAALAASLLWLAGDVAIRLADTATPSARTSFGGAFWLIEAMAALAAADALQRGISNPAARITIGAVLILPILAVIGGGAIDQLSIMKEYANRRSVFATAVATHLAIVGATLLPTLGIGLPLGVLLDRRARLRRPVFAVLNIIQTIPSIALFGLLIAPLAGLVAFAPLLGRIGISGIGATPAIIALTLYSLLPIVRSTTAGLEQVPGSVVDAATGMGMTPAQIFRRVEVPLALPVVVAGLRVTVVQAVGLTAVAALIGAGGLGAIIFQGLNGSAIDLVLLGVVPLVAIAITADIALKLAVTMLKMRSG
ncbi:osmoprotectant transport system permease protein [Kaistia soli DSM 19436]|uniref:Osmoprotectant transport system permease protein n=1 Tax=Kaistia soli DSM 19436 TaxID=1122133 RepID=A0A1M4YYJ0_9HYPH|nr:ABC transporter permease [Kaistia soli]SHF10406.1 osmoprotectant transport system permease protein [Kaistia soli DSM 19436]